MKVIVYLKKSSPEVSNICFRIGDRNVDIKVVSPLEVQDRYWDSDTLSYKRMTVMPATEQKRLPKWIASIIERAEKTFMDRVDSRWIRQVIEDALHPAHVFKRGHPNLLARAYGYLEKFDGAKKTKECIVRLERKMTRYHDYRREALGGADFTLLAETVTLEQMNAFRDHVMNEHLLRQGHLGFHAPRMLINHRPRPLSGTTVINIMSLFCTFLYWCKKMRYFDNEVYVLYGCKESTYGGPFFLTSEKRNILYNADPNDNPKLTVTRDVSVFHCCVGCHVGGLYHLTRDNVKDGFLEYIPQKTGKCKAKTVRVPLYEKVLEILERYDASADRLFPFRRIYAHNLGVQGLLKRYGIDRTVIILGTHGYNTAQKPPYEVATSHTAHKTSVGSLCRQVPNLSLIASTSRHVGGSRAFSHCRTINDDMKHRPVDMIGQRERRTYI